MRTSRLPSYLVVAVSLLLVSWQRGEAPARATVTIDSAVRHQTILGWGATCGRVVVSDALRDQVVAAAVDELGLTRLRLEPDRREWEFPYNDDADPATFNRAAFKSPKSDELVRAWVVPFKQRVEARGDPFNLYVSPSFFKRGGSGPAPDWMMEKPEEYAEWATAFLLHLKTDFGLAAGYYSICNEAGNDNEFEPQVVARMIKALGPRLKAEQLPTRIEFPECVNAGQTWRYLEATKDDEEMWSWVGLVTWHLYGDASKRPSIREFASKRGIPTGQTEFMGTTVQQLFDDLIEGGVSYWEHYVLAGPWGGNASYFVTHQNDASFQRYTEYWNFRQVMHYVRPGAVRVGAKSDDPEVRVVAFERDGKMTVVLLATTVAKGPATVAIAGLPAGSYGTCGSSAGVASYQELGVREVKAGSSLELNIKPGQVLTIYPTTGVNQAPVLTNARSSPDFLEPPGSEVTLSATATDPEGDKFAWRWRVVRQPDGANCTIASASAASTRVTGLSAPGRYVFEAAAIDGERTSSREVVLPVFEGNQPPRIVEWGNRLPVAVVHPETATELRGAAFDLEGDKLSFRWSVLRQPDGAAAKLESPAAEKCKVTGLTRPGEYEFRFEVSDGRNTASRELIVLVHPEKALKWPGTRPG